MIPPYLASAEGVQPLSGREGMNRVACPSPHPVDRIDTSCSARSLVTRAAPSRSPFEATTPLENCPLPSILDYGDYIRQECQYKLVHPLCILFKMTRPAVEFFALEPDFDCLT